VQRLWPLPQRRRSGYQDRFDLDDRLGAAVGGGILGEPENSFTFAVPAIHARTEASASMASALPRRHRWTAFCGTQRAEGGVQSIKVLIRQLPDLPGRITGQDLLLDKDVGEQGAAALLLNSHHDWGSCSIFEEVAGFFRKLLSSSQHLPSLRHDHRHHYS
jgi:hypothetical protein